MLQRGIQKGFTLIELITIMVLIAILIVVATMRDPTAGIQVDRQADRLANDLRYMQHLAMTRNERTRINFAAGQYTLTELDGSTAIDHPALPSNVVTMPSGVVVSTDLPNDFIVFDGLGQPYTDNTLPGTLLASTATIAFTGANVETVTVAPETGRVAKQ